MLSAQLVGNHVVPLKPIACDLHVFRPRRQARRRQPAAAWTPFRSQPLRPLRPGQGQSSAYRSAWATSTTGASSWLA